MSSDLTFLTNAPGKALLDRFRRYWAQTPASSTDSAQIEQGIDKFLAWVKSGKLQIKVYPSAKIHAKVYIMTFAEGDRDVGRVVTGSSNFSQSGLVHNLEFNVELKNRSDYDFALNKFNELWADAVEVFQNVRGYDRDPVTVCTFHAL